MPRGIRVGRRGLGGGARRLREQRGQPDGGGLAVAPLGTVLGGPYGQHPVDQPPASRSSARSFHTCGSASVRAEVEAQLDLRCHWC